MSSGVKEGSQMLPSCTMLASCIISSLQVLWNPTCPGARIPCQHDAQYHTPLSFFMQMNSSGLCSWFALANLSKASVRGVAPPMSNNLPKTLICFSDGANQIQKHGLLPYASHGHDVLMQPYVRFQSSKGVRT